jgi:hypothetical protein
MDLQLVLFLLGAATTALAEKIKSSFLFFNACCFSLFSPERSAETPVGLSAVGRSFFMAAGQTADGEPHGRLGKYRRELYTEIIILKNRLNQHSGPY